jgi:hypothetical protein
VKRTVLAHTALITIASLAACKLPSMAPERPKAAPIDRPSWIGKTTFTDPLGIYGVGKVEIEAKGCWEPTLLVGAARNRARAALAPEIEKQSDDQKTVRLAKLEGSEPISTWFDGQTTIYALVGIPTGTSAIDGERGGVRSVEMIDKLKRHNLAALEASGACGDGHRRSELPCCGPLKTFCSDPKRFDLRGPDQTCACGKSAPCLYDFACQDRQGTKKCRCDGPKCPCGILKCDRGEVCEDGRCF